MLKQHVRREAEEVLWHGATSPFASVGGQLPLVLPLNTLPAAACPEPIGGDQLALYATVVKRYSRVAHWRALVRS